VERALSDPGYADDHGAPDPALDAALAAWQHAGEPPGQIPVELIGARLLVPIVAVLAEAESGGREKTTDMAVVTIRGADGGVGLPAFTSLDRLASWHGQARPLPVCADQAAQAALFENADRLVIDPGGPVPFVVAGRALRALAAARIPVPPAEDAEVVEVLRARLTDEPGIVAAALVARDDPDGPDALLAVAVDPERWPDPEPLAQRVCADLAEEEVLRDRLDRGLDVVVVPAAALPAGSLLLDKRPDAADC
jgi:SseB protein N-terminal domain